VIIGITALLAATAAYYVAITPAAHEYISKRVLDTVDDFERKVSDTNSGKNFPTGGCTSSIKMAAICIGGALAIGKALLDSHQKGGCGEAESNTSCPSTSTATSTPSMTSTPSPSATPTLQITPTPSSTPTRLPTRTPTPKPTLVPIQPQSILERRLQMKGLE